MANIASKSALRKAAEAKRDRHAQRTPLPPRRREAEADDAPASKSEAKARRFIDAVAEYGWESRTCNPSGEQDHVEVTSTRDKEMIVIDWLNGVQQSALYYRESGGKARKLRNASEAKRYAARGVEVAPASTAPASTAPTTIRPRPRPPRNSAPAPQPSFVVGVTEEEIREALAGQAITWVNRISRERETAKVTKDRDKISVKTSPDGEKTVNVLCVHTGYRSFSLASLVEVNGRKLSAEDSDILGS